MEDDLSIRENRYTRAPQSASILSRLRGINTLAISSIGSFFSSPSPALSQYGAYDHIDLEKGSAEAWSYSPNASDEDAQLHGHTRSPTFPNELDFDSEAQIHRARRFSSPERHEDPFRDVKRVWNHFTRSSPHPRTQAHHAGRDHFETRFNHKASSFKTHRHQDSGPDSRYYDISPSSIPSTLPSISELSSSNTPPLTPDMYNEYDSTAAASPSIDAREYVNRFGFADNSHLPGENRDRSAYMRNGREPSWNRDEDGPASHRDDIKEGKRRERLTVRRKICLCSAASETTHRITWRTPGF